MQLCYAPLFISTIILGISQIHLTKAWTLVDTVSFMNSAVHSFLHCWRLCDLGAAVGKTAKQIFSNQTEEAL